MIILRQKDFGNRENKAAKKAFESSMGEKAAKTANAYGNAVGTVPQNVQERREAVYRAVYRGQQAANSGDVNQFINRAKQGKYVGAEGQPGSGAYGKGINTTTTRATTTNQLINAKSAIKNNGLVGTTKGGLFGDKVDVHISTNPTQNKPAPAVLSGLGRVKPGFAVGSY